MIPADEQSDQSVEDDSNFEVPEEMGRLEHQARQRDGVNDDFRLKPHSGSGLTLMISALKSVLKFTKRVSAHETPRETRHPADFWPLSVNVYQQC